jgi:DNA-binding response OmpR family regulator
MPNTSQKTILIAEDEKPYLRALTLKLEREGFKVKQAEDGEQAITILRKEKVDLVLLDLIMPKIDGFGVLAAMKEEKNTTPVIVLSNLGQADDEKKSKELGACDFLNKSNIQIIEVISKVQSIFSK